MIIDDSQRLSFALIAPDDAQTLFELDQDPAVMQYINGGKISTMDDIVNVMLPRMNTYRNPDKGWGLYKVVVKQSDEYIGWVLVRPMDFFSDNVQWDNLELGWRFKQSSWGKGYATEAAKTIMNHLAQHKGYRHFCAIAEPDNTASLKVMEKLGMKYMHTSIHKDPLGDVEAAYYQIDLV